MVGKITTEEEPARDGSNDKMNCEAGVLGFEPWVSEHEGSGFMLSKRLTIKNLRQSSNSGRDSISFRLGTNWGHR